MLRSCKDKLTYGFLYCFLKFKTEFWTMKHEWSQTTYLCLLLLSMHSATPHCQRPMPWVLHLQQKASAASYGQHDSSAQNQSASPNTSQPFCKAINTWSLWFSLQSFLSLRMQNTAPTVVVSSEIKWSWGISTACPLIKNSSNHQQPVMHTCTCSLACSWGF